MHFAQMLALLDGSSAIRHSFPPPNYSLAVVVSGLWDEPTRRKLCRHRLCRHTATLPFTFTSSVMRIQTKRNTTFNSNLRCNEWTAKSLHTHRIATWWQQVCRRRQESKATATSTSAHCLMQCLPASILQFAKENPTKRGLSSSCLENHNILFDALLGRRSICESRFMVMSKHTQTKDRQGIALEDSTGGHLGTQSHRWANMSLP